MELSFKENNEVETQKTICLSFPSSLAMPVAHIKKLWRENGTFFCLHRYPCWSILLTRSSRNYPTHLQNIDGNTETTLLFRTQGFLFMSAHMSSWWKSAVLAHHQLMSKTKTAAIETKGMPPDGGNLSGQLLQL